MATVHGHFLWGCLGPPTMASLMVPFPYRCGCLAVCRVSISPSVDPDLFSAVRLLDAFKQCLELCRSTVKQQCTVQSQPNESPRRRGRLHDEAIGLHIATRHTSQKVNIYTQKKQGSRKAREHTTNEYTSNSTRSPEATGGR